MSSNAKVKVYSAMRLTEEVVDVLKSVSDFNMCKGHFSTHEELLANVPGVTVIHCVGCNDITKEVLDAAGPSLKAVCTHSAGFNHIDLKACKERNIRVGYLGKVVAGCMAEFTIGLMIATGRRFKEAIADVARGGWANWGSNYMNGYQLMGSTVGIVGLGFIGQELAIRLKAFNVKILYTGPRRKPEGDALGIEYKTFNELLQQSDFVVATCALNEQTEGLFNSKAFDHMKPTSIFVNVTRGRVVDQEALYEALTTQKIFAAGIDVATPEPLPKEHPLVALENCVLLPHIGTSTKSMRKQMGKASLENVLAVLNGNPIPSELLL